VLDEDGKGGYRFDRMAFDGPIIAESPEERKERMKHVVILPEPASPTRIAL
jgi:hypothetical protein